MPIPEKAEVPESSGAVRKSRRTSHFNNMHLPEATLSEEQVPGAKRPREQEEPEAEGLKIRRLADPVPEMQEASLDAAQAA